MILRLCKSSTNYVNDFGGKNLILDFDCTDDRVHGMQVGRAFHGYYDDYCFLPLYVFCGEQLLVSYLRPSNIDLCPRCLPMLKNHRKIVLLVSLLGCTPLVSRTNAQNWKTMKYPG